MIKRYLYVGKTAAKGRGIFTKQSIRAGILIEESPVIVMNADDRNTVDKTLLRDYIFAWGEAEEQCAMALGYVALYNHSYKSNCEYYMDFKKEIIQVKTMRSIEAGEELTINYNGDWDDKKTIWFEALP